MNWKSLSNLEQIDTIITQSFELPVLLFKHSTRCIVSKMALKNFESQYNCNDKMVCYFLDLLEYRNISNEIATRFNIVHQSPQIIVLRNGVAVHNASHENIDALILGKFSV